MSGIINCFSSFSIFYSIEISKYLFGDENVSIGDFFSIITPKFEIKCLIAKMHVMLQQDLGKILDGNAPSTSKNKYVVELKRMHIMILLSHLDGVSNVLVFKSEQSFGLDWFLHYASMVTVLEEAY